MIPKSIILSLSLAPNGPEKWGCRTHVEWEFETYIVKFETYSVKRDYETKKTAGALEPPEPPSLAPMQISLCLWEKLVWPPSLNK